MVAGFPGSGTLSEIPWMLQKQRTRGGVGGCGETEPGPQTNALSRANRHRHSSSESLS